MSHYPPSLLNLVDQFTKLPGIGKKTAERLALHVLKASRQDAELLAGSILELKNRVRLCANCFALSEKNVCEICSNPSRNNGILCVVEKTADMASIERAGAFKGRYHILQGVLSPMENIGPDEIRVNELFRRVREEKIKEVILATGTNVEGEATASFISSKLKAEGIKTTRIATGIPMGGDLKYVDQVTLKRAMEIRYEA